MSSIGKNLLWKGRLELIDSYLARIPVHLIEQKPWIQYMKAQTLDLRGKFQEAVEIYGKAFEICHNRKSGNGEMMCLTEMGRNYFHMGDLENAEIIMKELLNSGRLKPENRPCSPGSDFHGSLSRQNEPV